MSGPAAVAAPGSTGQSAQGPWSGRGGTATIDAFPTRVARARTFANDRPMTQMTPYEAVGGEPMVAALVDRFYLLMDTVPQFAGIRAMHPADLKGSRDKLFMFLSGWFGGPDLYVAAHGHPRLRARHMPFSIGSAERDQWVACMVLAMEDVGIPEGLRAKLLENFFNTADFMRNREG